MEENAAKMELVRRNALLSRTELIYFLEFSSCQNLKASICCENFVCTQPNQLNINQLFIKVLTLNWSLRFLPNLRQTLGKQPSNYKFWNTQWLNFNISESGRKQGAKRDAQVIFTQGFYSRIMRIDPGAEAQRTSLSGIKEKLWTIKQQYSLPGYKHILYLKKKNCI